MIFPSDRSNRRRPILAFFLLAGVLAVLVWMSALKEKSDPGATISFFDVGQGDAALIQIGKGREVLIDGGPDTSVLRELGKVMRPLDRSIDLIIVTHPESDHITGLLDAVERYTVGAVLMTGVLRDTAVYRNFLEAVEERGIPIYLVREGTRIRIGKGEFRILSPARPLFGLKLGRTNNTGIVTEFRYGEQSALFTADIDRTIEERLEEGELLSDIDILKVAHHGSKTATREAFLKTVRPETAVISVGERNPYGHPHPETLSRLDAVGANIIRTDEEGTIRFFTDGVSFVRIPPEGEERLSFLRVFSFLW